MSEEKKDLLNEEIIEETVENTPVDKKKMSKKTKAVIIALAAAAVAVIVILISFGIGGDADKNVGNETASSGETSTLPPGIENSAVVDLNGQNGASPGENSASGTGSGNGSSSQNGSSSGTDSQAQAGDSGETPAQGDTTTVPENRSITVYVVMPENNRATDTLEIYINGESIGEAFEVNVDGSTYRYVTPEKYTGDVAFEARLLGYGTSASSIAYEGTDFAELRLPLNRAEENLGDDF